MYPKQPDMPRVPDAVVFLFLLILVFTPFFPLGTPEGVTYTCILCGPKLYQVLGWMVPPAPITAKQVKRHKKKKNSRLTHLGVGDHRGNRGDILAELVGLREVSVERGECRHLAGGGPHRRSKHAA